MIEILRLTEEAKVAMSALGYDTAQSMLYSQLGLKLPEDKCRTVFEYRGLSCLCFQSADGGSYYAMSPAHTTLVAKAFSPDLAAAGLEAMVNKLLSSRELSNYETQIDKAIQRSSASVLKLAAKDSVSALAQTLVGVYGKDKLDSCYFVAARVVSECRDISQKDRDWAENYKLKFFVLGCRIEELLDQVIQRMAKSEQRRADFDD